MRISDKLELLAPQATKKLEQAVYNGATRYILAIRL